MRDSAPCRRLRATPCLRLRAETAGSSNAGRTSKPLPDATDKTGTCQSIPRQISRRFSLAEVLNAGTGRLYRFVLRRPSSRRLAGPQQDPFGGPSSWPAQCFARWPQPVGHSPWCFVTSQWLPPDQAVFMPDHRGQTLAARLGGGGLTAGGRSEPCGPFLRGFQIRINPPARRIGSRTRGAATMAA